MLRLKDKLNTEIATARGKIVELFIEQCRNGSQSKELSASSVHACGQFIGPSDVTNKLSQRGIHGSAAALRVLAEQLSHENGTDIRDVVEGLVGYISKRAEVETERADDEDKAPVKSKCEIDANNVIKMSEVLYALSFVPPSIAGADELKRQIVEKLRSAMIDEKAWGYFFDDDQAELLPTAYAVFALSAVEENVTTSVKYLNNELAGGAVDPEREIELGADITVRVACLYVLCFRKTRGHDHLGSGVLQSLFSPMWRTLAPLLEEDIEQNVEYWRGGETYYVRLPWQLYLLAIAAHLNFWRFGSSISQARLNSVVDAINGQGFRYPHSGKMISSRTNGIAYEVLGLIQRELSTWRQFWPAYVVDKTRTALGSRVAKGIMWLALVGLMVWSVIEWVRKGTIDDLAPEFIGAAIIALLALASKRQ